MTDINTHIARLAELTRQQAAIKREIDEEKVYFERLAEDQLAASKVKGCEWRDGDASVQVVTSNSVKIISQAGLQQLFKSAFSDYVKIEETADLNGAAVKRILAAVFLGEVINQTPEGAINQFTKDEKQRKLLAKKLKGVNPIADRDNIIAVTGCSVEDAELYAAMYAEVVAHANWQNILQVSGCANPDEALQLLRASLTVDQGYKVTVTTGD